MAETHVTQWVAAVEQPRWPCVLSWMGTDWPGPHHFLRSGANNIRISWNNVVRYFLSTKSEWLWSTHNDVVYEPGTLKRLLSWNKPLVGALVFMRAGPAIPHIWRGRVPGHGGYRQQIRETLDWLCKHQEALVYGPNLVEPRPDDALIQCDFTSHSCMLMHRSVLEAMKDDWFAWDDDVNGGGEDRRFFERAKEVGYEGFVDRSCVVGHLELDYPAGTLDFLAWATVTDLEQIRKPGWHLCKRSEVDCGKKE